MDSALLVASESILSAYPLLIKLVDASIFLQTGLRMIVYTVVAVIAIFATGVPWNPTSLGTVETFAIGLWNILHVGTSYVAFDQLAAGNAMALFYTYPVWNIIGSALLFGESLSSKSLLMIFVALLGSVLLAKPETGHWNILGIVCALLAALTETGIYLWFKAKPQESEESNEPFTKMAQMYGSSGLLWLVGGILLLALGFIGSDIFKISGNGLSAILLFNTIVGFIGYALRFYLVPRVPTVLFSALSFFGIVSAYLFGIFFANDKPSMLQMVGALAIVLANTVLLRKETA